MEAHQVEHWFELKDALKARLSEQAYHTWVTQMTCTHDDGQKVVVELPNLFSLDWVNNHYRHVLEEELEGIDGDLKLDLRLSEQGAVETAVSTSNRTVRPQAGSFQEKRPRSAPLKDWEEEPSFQTIRGALPLRDDYRFESFVTGPSNQLASAAAQSVADNPGQAYNPLFIFGRVGLGKTHLIQAIGHCIQRKRPGARVQYQTTENFVNDVIKGIRFEQMDKIRRLYRDIDVLLIDDIQFIAGKEACQSEFFHTFNALHDAGKQVAVTSDKLPHEIKDLEDRVRTRFQWGLIVDLQPPELETRVAIVNKKAESDGIDLSNEVSMFIAQSVRSNVRELEGCLIRVGAYASLTNQPITIELAREVLKNVLPGKNRALTCERVVKAVAEHFDLKVSDLKSSKRGRAIALPRQISMYLCRKHVGASYPEIGQALGGKDHTTALNAYNRITQRMEEPDVRRATEDLERLLLE